jgi:hypothetical protein
VQAKDRLRVGHRPGQLGDLAPVSIPRQLASDTADGLPQDQSDSHAIRDRKIGQAVPEDVGTDRDSSSDQAPVPDESRAAEDEIERSRDELAPVVGQGEDPGPEDASNRGPEDDPGSMRAVEAARLELISYDRSRSEKTKSEHGPEAVERNGSDFEQDGKHRLPGG